MSRWTWSKLLIFMAVVCTVSLICSVAGSVAPKLVLTVPKNGFAISSKTYGLTVVTFRSPIGSAIIYSSLLMIEAGTDES
jgi:hypothetical protein